MGGDGLTPSVEGGVVPLVDDEPELVLLGLLEEDAELIDDEVPEESVVENLRVRLDVGSERLPS